MKDHSFLPFCPNMKHLANIYPSLKTSPQVYLLASLCPHQIHFIFYQSNCSCLWNCKFLVCPTRLWGYWGQGHILCIFAVPANTQWEHKCFPWLHNWMNEWMMDFIHGSMDLAFPTAMMQSLSDKKCLNLCQGLPIFTFLTSFQIQEAVNSVMSHTGMRISCIL